MLLDSHRSIASFHLDVAVFCYWYYLNSSMCAVNRTLGSDGSFAPRPLSFTNVQTAASANSKSARSVAHWYAQRPTAK